jgi:GH25 family lysozyme M1 (1,4-beta-N-acetylmuramidase)
MAATPIWIAGYGHRPTGNTASLVRIASYRKTFPGATETWIVGYGKRPLTGPTIVWMSSSAGATPIWIAGVGGAVRG